MLRLIICLELFDLLLFCTVLLLRSSSLHQPPYFILRLVYTLQFFSLVLGQSAATSRLIDSVSDAPPTGKKFVWASPFR